jgi:hypothetical protein
MSNKEIAKKAQTILSELGYSVSLGHTYELLSKIAGFSSWNVASASGGNLSEVLSRGFRHPIETSEIAPIKGLRQYEIEVKVEDITVFKDYQIWATSAKEAKAALNEYLQIRSGSLKEEDAKYAQTLELLNIEDENSFNYDNWGIEGIPFETEAGEIRDLTRGHEQGDYNLFGDEVMTVSKPLAERLKEPGLKYCYWITEQSKDEAGFVPVLVIENDDGFYPMRGLIPAGDIYKHIDYGASPWHWGKTFEEAIRVCDKVNQDRFNLSHNEA